MSEKIYIEQAFFKKFKGYESVSRYSSHFDPKSMNLFSVDWGAVVKPNIYIHRSFNTAFKGPVKFDKEPFYLAKLAKSDTCHNAAKEGLDSYALVVNDLEKFIDACTIHDGNDLGGQFVESKMLLDTLTINVVNLKPANYSFFAEPLIEHIKKNIFDLSKGNLSRMGYLVNELQQAVENGAVIKIYPEWTSIHDKNGIMLLQERIYCHEFEAFAYYKEYYPEFYNLLDECWQQKRKESPRNFHIVLDSEGFRQVWKGVKK